jgi:hypothetical protein
MLSELTRAVRFLACFQEVTGSNVSQVTDYTVFVVLLSLTRQISGQYLNKALSASVQP